MCLGIRDLGFKVWDLGHQVSGFGTVRLYNARSSSCLRFLFTGLSIADKYSGYACNKSSAFSIMHVACRWP